jgi:hypothetical protein
VEIMTREGGGSVAYVSRGRTESASGRKQILNGSAIARAATNTVLNHGAILWVLSAYVRESGGFNKAGGVCCLVHLG